MTETGIEKDQYISFLHDRIRFLEQELRNSEQEKLVLKQQSEYKTSPSLKELRKQFNHLITQYPDEKDVEEALDDTEQDFTEWCSNLNHVLYLVEEKDRRLFELGKQHGVFTAETYEEHCGKLEQKYSQ